MPDRFGMTGNYLIHSAKGTSWEKKDHKYVSRTRNENGIWIYKYGNNKETANPTEIEKWYDEELTKAVNKKDSSRFYSLLNEAFSSIPKIKSDSNKDMYKLFGENARLDKNINTVYGMTKEDWIKFYNK